ncbi:restriction endonuclease subunit S [Advenella sp. RU8]|uniref:restriction endonuclease subunit S n=1 Tax=Advenella sp. RU8 TaxID=3399575 RepID=UPI003AAC29EB
MAADQKITEVVDFNPPRPIKRGAIAPFVDMAALAENQRDIAYVSEREFAGGGSRFRNGDTLFARITPCLENGKTAKVNALPAGSIAHGSTEFIVMAAKAPEYDEDYVYYLARHPDFRSFAEARMEGTSGRQRVSWQALSDFSFAFPPSDKRQIIGSILRKIDDKIDLNRHLNKTLEAMAQAIFKSWFVDFDPVKAKIAAIEQGEDPLRAAMRAISGKTNEELDQMPREHHDQLAATAELFSDAMEDSELGDIPKGWEAVPLSKMIQLIGGGTPKRSESSYWAGTIPWFSVRDVPDDSDVWVVDTEEKITETGLQKSSTKLLLEGTTIISARGTVGKLALVGKEMAMNQSCYGVIGTEGVGDLFNYFNLKESVEKLKKNTHGAVFDTITQATFETVLCVRPRHSVMKQFDNTVVPLLKCIKLNVFQNRELAGLRDTLLPKLLSGELTVSCVLNGEDVQ